MYMNGELGLATADAKEALLDRSVSPGVRERLEAIVHAHGVIEKGMERLQLVSRELDRLMRPRVPRLAPVDLRAVASSLVSVAGPGLAVPLSADLVGEASAYASEEDVRQILLILLANASEAAQGASSVRVLIECGATPDGRAFLSVADDGPGIPYADQRKIFTPFFTTKAAHMGIGLSLAQRLAADQEGEIVCSSTPGAGARFELRLPAAALPSVPASRQASTITPQR